MGFKINLPLMILFLLFMLLSGCMNISESKAEETAKGFVNERVKFFEREGDASSGVPQYSIDTMDIQKENNNWIVVLHVESNDDGEIKDSDLTVIVNKKGDVVEFNGVKVKPE